MAAFDQAHNDLFIAVHDKCDITAVRRLIGGGIDVNAATPAGCTPLMLSVMPSELGNHNSLSAIRSMALELLKLGADPSKADSNGRTAIDYAWQLIDPEWKDQFGESALSQYGPSAIDSVHELVSILESARDQKDSEQTEADQSLPRPESGGS